MYYLPDEPSLSQLKKPGDDLGFMIVAPLVLSTLAGLAVLGWLPKYDTVPNGALSLVITNVSGRVLPDEDLGQAIIDRLLERGASSD